MNLSRASKTQKKFYTTGSFRRSVRAKPVVVKKYPTIAEEENETGEETNSDNLRSNLMTVDTKNEVKTKIIIF